MTMKTGVNNNRKGMVIIAVLWTVVVLSALGLRWDCVADCLLPGVTCLIGCLM